MDSYDSATNSYRYNANQDYFLGAPVVQQLEFVPAPDQLLALQRGELDAATIGVEERAIPDAQLEAFDDARFGRITAPGELTRAPHFNLTKRAPFADLRFRQAVACAIDREDLVGTSSATSRCISSTASRRSFSSTAVSCRTASCSMPTRITTFAKDTFDNWYFTPGGVFGAYPGPLNKHAFVTGRKTGFQ